MYTLYKFIDKNFFFNPYYIKSNLPTGLQIFQFGNYVSIGEDDGDGDWLLIPDSGRVYTNDEHYYVENDLDKNMLIVGVRDDLL